jgi:hypothetical protein
MPERERQERVAQILEGYELTNDELMQIARFYGIVSEDEVAKYHYGTYGKEAKLSGSADPVPEQGPTEYDDAISKINAEDRSLRSLTPDARKRRLEELLAPYGLSNLEIREIGRKYGVALEDRYYFGGGGR